MATFSNKIRILPLSRSRGICIQFYYEIEKFKYGQDRRFFREVFFPQAFEAEYLFFHGYFHIMALAR